MMFQRQREQRGSLTQKSPQNGILFYCQVSQHLYSLVLGSESVGLTLTSVGYTQTLEALHCSTSASHQKLLRAYSIVSHSWDGIIRTYCRQFTSLEKNGEYIMQLRVIILNLTYMFQSTSCLSVGLCRPHKVKIK